MQILWIVKLIKMAFNMIEINPKSRQGNTFGKNDFFGNTIVIHDQCFKMLKICYEIRIPSKQKKNGKRYC